MLSSALLSLVLSTPDAEAGGEVSIETIEIAHHPIGLGLVFVGHDEDILSITADLESGAGDESVDLIESDAWLHGAANISALPAKEASVTVTVYDTASAALISFSGTLASDGSVSLTSDAKPDENTCTQKSDCKEESSTTAIDIEVLAAEVFLAAKGYDLALDLNGADACSIAYADIVITEGKTSTKAEFGWDDIGSVWEAELSVEHEGLIEAKVTTYDTKGKKLESSKGKLGTAWEDGGYGINTLASDDDPLTRVGFASHYGTDLFSAGHQRTDMIVVSDGWTVGNTVPATAQIELTGGETLVIPVNSYQVAAEPSTLKVGDEASYEITVEGLTALISAEEMAVAQDNPIFQSAGGPANGIGLLVQNGGDGTYSISVTTYGLDAAKLPTKADVVVTTFDKSDTKQAQFIFPVDFDQQLTAVYGIEVATSGDPIGIDLAGKISLLAAKDKKGKQKTLSKGKFYGSISRDADGDLSLAGADKDQIQAKGDILIGGEPIDFELTDTNGDGEIDAPPVVFYHNGKGTRAVATGSNGSPGLL